MDVTAEQLQEQMATALSAGDVPAYCAAEDGFENALLEQASALFRSGQFAASATYYEAMRQLNEQLLDVLKSLPEATDAAESGNGRTPIAAARERAPSLLASWEAMRDFAAAHALRLDGRFQEAQTQFLTAAAAFDRSAEERQAATARATATSCEGFQNLKLGYFRAAAAKFQGAEAQFQQADQIQDTESTGAVEDAAAKSIDVQFSHAMYLTAASRADLIEGRP
ncbi:MAG: hypothetical protein JOZ75_10130, partial [Candidatus Dormibacteraeota bacterium]|nr:hypothetical protein [Candidatus Dormibacteraeota bacterium]